MYDDEEDFELLDGQFQSILVRKENLTAGVYYIGVFNVWGYTGSSEESHDTAKYSLYFNLDSAGVPCPRNHLSTASSPGDGEFCSSGGGGDWCDFNTGQPVWFPYLLAA